MLIRSSVGLRNKKMFHENKITVYVEGGRKSNQRISDDAAFWNSILENLFPQDNFRFEPKGSKSAVLAIALHNGLIVPDGNFLAVDSDFDDLFNHKINHPRIFYTSGYSWENDILQVPVIKCILQSVCPGCDYDATLDDAIKRLLKEISEILYRLVQADIVGCAGHLSLIPRKKEDSHMRLVRVGKNGRGAALRNDEVRKLLRKSNSPGRGKYYLLPRKKHDPILHCYGHLVESLFYFKFMKFLRDHFSQEIPISRESFKALCLSSFRFAVRAEPERVSGGYYWHLA